MEILMMKYENLYRDFKGLFPEDDGYFREQEKQTGASADDGMHVVFGLIIVPFVTKIVNESSEKAEKAFDFFEKMEKAEDPKIAEVLEFTVLESILSEDKNMIPKYAEYFGEETTKAAKSIGRWFG